VTKGGHARSGPAPDPNALRRDRDKGEWTELPAAGRVGEAPAWPLTQPTGREIDLWEVEWRRPQAIIWERNGQELEVALFVRAVADAESPRASVAARTLVRQLMDSLGLSVPGMRSNRWRIVDTTAKAASRAPQPAARRSVKSRGSARARLQVVEGNGGA